MRSMIWVRSATGTMLMLGLLMGQGCPPAPPTDDTNDTDATSADDLTAEEKSALAAAAAAPSSLTLSTDVSQAATSNDDEDNAQSVNFGTCPEVTIDSSISETLGTGTTAASLTIDFGTEPCEVYSVEGGETLVCSGSATGAFSALQREMDISFDQLTCNDQSLNGTASISYENLEPGAALTGEWDIQWQPGSETITTAGAGTISYVPVSGGCCDVTTVETFTGTIAWNADGWDVTMIDVMTSYEQYANLIPFSGTVTLDGPAIRPISITFDEESPTTQVVSVQVNSGPTFTLTLTELAEYAMLTP